MVESYKNKFNMKFKQKKDKSNSIKQISKLTGYKLGGLKQIYKKGYGAYYSNPSSVRKSVKSPEAWSYARVYSAVMGGAAAKIDKDLLQK
jgi:hypothetical protein|tara:strand:+ start:299 stop:568 length:270 start_codon:yes stop_codon:yes gene_type:complete